VSGPALFYTPQPDDLLRGTVVMDVAAFAVT
jgi:hypothetical protein